jgi:hypothetical protein
MRLVFIFFITIISLPLLGAFKVNFESSSPKTLYAAQSVERVLSRLFPAISRQRPFDITVKFVPKQMGLKTVKKKLVYYFPENWMNDFTLQRKLYSILTTLVNGTRTLPKDDLLPQWMVAGINCLMRNQSTSGRLFRNHRNLQVLRALSLEDKNFYNPNLTQIEATQLGISTLFWFEEYSFLLLDSLDQFKLLKTFPSKAALNPKKAEKDLFTSLEKEIKKKGFDNLRTFVKAKAKSLAWSELYSKDPKLTLKEFSLIRQVELPKFDIDNTMSGLVEHVDILELPEKLASRSDIEVIKYRLTMQLNNFASYENRTLKLLVRSLLEQIYLLPDVNQETFTQAVNKLNDFCKRQVVIDNYLIDIEEKEKGIKAICPLRLDELKQEKDSLTLKQQNYLLKVESDYLSF